jgi:hypothetical protein
MAEFAGWVGKVKRGKEAELDADSVCLALWNELHGIFGIPVAVTLIFVY